jgi:hypothetical protein
LPGVTRCRRASRTSLPNSLALAVGAVTRPVSLTLRLRISDNDPVVTLRGREAWALMALKAAGERGCTPIDHPGPRWSGYVHDLRKLGIVIETIRERHGGPFAGEHARYVLRSLVVILEKEGAAPFFEASGA